MLSQKSSTGDSALSRSLSLSIFIPFSLCNIYIFMYMHFSHSNMLLRCGPCLCASRTLYLKRWILNFFLWEPTTTLCVYCSLRVYAAREDVEEWMPYTVVMDDPTGNSQIEGEAVDSSLTRERYLECQIPSPTPNSSPCPRISLFLVKNLAPKRVDLHRRRF